MFRRIKNRPWKKPQFQKRRHLLECLESRRLMANSVWDGGGDGASWTDARNWAGDTLPGASDDVTIDVATNPTIRIAGGAQSIRSLVSKEALNITGGSLRVAEAAQVNNSLAIGSATLYGGTWNVSEGIQVTGSATLDGVTVQNNVNVQDGKSLTVKNAAELNGELALGTNSNLTAGAQASLAVSAGTMLSNVNLEARDNAAITFPTVTTLTSVNLNASSGGQILLPAVTAYTSSSGGNTLQANGVGSRIALPALSTFVGATYLSYQTYITAKSGGTVVLAGQFSGNATWTLDGAESGFNADGVTKVTTGSVNVSQSATLTLPALLEAANVNMNASTGGQILLPALTTYTSSSGGNTLQANGAGSRIALPALSTFVGATYLSYQTYVTAKSGGTVVLAGQFSGNTTWTLDGAASELNADGVIKLPGASINVSQGATLTLPALLEAANVNMNASTGGQILLPALTTYTSSSGGNTLQANGVGSRIALPALSTFVGATYLSYQTSITAKNGGAVVLAGQFSGNTTWTLHGVESVLDVASVHSLSRASLVAANGAVWVFPAGWAPHLDSGNSLSTSGEGSRFVNQASLSISETSLAINTSAFTNEGALNPLAGGVFDFNGSFSIDDPGIVTGVSSGRITVAGDLLGSTQNADQFAPQAEVRFDGAGKDTNPQRWEAMSRDRGPFESGFIRNFAFGTVKLANNTYVRLVDESRNTASGTAQIADEAVYVDTLDVPAGTTLDLNGLHLYARTLQGGGSILNGTVRTDIAGDEMADLSLVMTCDYVEPNVGQNVTFTVTLTNAGPNGATAVAVYDLLPVGLRFVSAASSHGTYNSSTGVWTLGTIAPNANATLQIVATVTSIGTIINTAEVTMADQYDLDSTPNNRVPNEDDEASVTIRSSSLHPWRNPRQAEDVNDDGSVTPLDALIIINRLNASGPEDLPVPLPIHVNPPPYWDADGDDAVGASDVLAVVNFINNHAASGLAASAGEADADAGLTTNSPIQTSPFAPQHLPLVAGQASRDQDVVLVDQVFTELAEGNLHA